MRSARQIREIFLRGNVSQPICMSEVARFVIDTTYLGFEDPRSSADAYFGNGSVRFCTRMACDAAVTIDRVRDSYTVKGSCADEPVCAAEINYEKDFDLRKLAERRLVKRASDKQLSFICPHVECEFNYGYTIDGNFGTSGTCMRGIEVEPETLN